MASKFNKFKNAIILFGGYKLSLFGVSLYQTYINEYHREPVDLNVKLIVIFRNFMETDT